ncbi:MAG: aspartate kinase [Actinobacteria bacterium]|nr:MAG: aspartate kinase [Actinomycetota bacterium]
MALVVQKYGGSSVANAELIKNVALKVVESARAGNKVVAVVSALGDTTDDLITKARQLCDSPPDRETDALLATGEQMSSALLAIAICNLGEKAISLHGSQIGIKTDGVYTKAKITQIEGSRIKAALDEGNIVVIAGFQGVTDDEELTTLGRGGSDTTAVALAAELGADYCEIFTDVEGVFSADPRLEPKARLLPVVSYEEMLEMASSGAKVLQLRSVEYGRNYKVELHVRSSFSTNPGTIVKEESFSMEKAIVSAVTHNDSEAKVTIMGVPDKPGIAARVFGKLAENEINVDMILQNVSQSGHSDISFTINEEDIDKARQVMDSLVKELKAKGTDFDTEIARVTLVGAGMKSHPGIAAKMFEVLASNGINIEMISTSSIKVSCVIRKAQIGSAVRELHEAFGLEKNV